MEKYTRGLSGTKLRQFKQSELVKFLLKKDELFLGIRNNYVNFYYRGMNIAKIEGAFNKASIAKKYLTGKPEYKTNKKNEKVVVYSSIDYNKFKTDYLKIKNNVDKHVDDKKKTEEDMIEKDVQQSIILTNNKNFLKGKSDWFCLDMEYQHKAVNGTQTGRFDIIAINMKTKPNRVALIELKVGNGAFSGDSGLIKHAQDWHDFIDKNYYSKSPFEEDENYYLKYELKEMLKNKLGENYNIKLTDKPEFYCLICSGNSAIESICMDTRRYVWEKDKVNKSGFKGIIRNENIVDKLGYDITDINNKKVDNKIYVKFLFAKAYGKNISDVINGPYDKIGLGEK